MKIITKPRAVKSTVSNIEVATEASLFESEVDIPQFLMSLSFNLLEL